MGREMLPCAHLLDSNIKPVCLDCLRSFFSSIITTED